jgi:hypothetical protein
MTSRRVISAARAAARRLRFSLKTLLIVFTLAALWLGHTVHRARQQKDAVEAIHAKYGEVAYAHQRSEASSGDVGHNLSLEPQAPAWLVSLLGADYFQTVERVDVRWIPLKDDWLANLDKLPGLKILQIHGAHFSAPAICRLKGLRNFEILYVGWVSDITDDTFQTIGSATKLRDLRLGACPQVTDAGVEHLANLRELKNLDLSSSQLTDGGLAHLSQLTNLKVLNLAKTKISDHGLKQLTSIKSLRQLHLSGTKVSDDGLQHLERLQQLTGVDLQATAVTQAGAERLMAKLPMLEWLIFGENEVIERAVPTSPKTQTGSRTQ